MHTLKLLFIFAFGAKKHFAKVKLTKCNKKMNIWIFRIGVWDKQPFKRDVQGSDKFQRENVTVSTMV